MRKAKYAGAFYPADKEHLKKFIEYSFTGVNIDKFKGNKIFGGIAPHAGYAYSGKTASYFYKILKNGSFDFDIVVLIGTNHSSFGRIVVNTEDFEMPFGNVKTSAFASELANRLNANNEEDEHSLEVQLPFLQYSLEKKVFEIIPLILGDISYEKARKIAQIIFELVKDKKVLVIASGDFTHFGNNYGFLPFPADENANEKVKKIDNEAIEQIVAMNTEKFLEKAEKTTICGTGAFAVAIELCRLLGAKKGELLHYTTSSDISHDFSNIVGYGSLVFI